MTALIPAAGAEAASPVGVDRALAAHAAGMAPGSEMALPDAPQQDRVGSPGRSCFVSS